MTVPIVSVIVLIISTSSGFVEALTLNFLHTNNVHARFEQFDEKGGTCSVEEASNQDCYGGVSRRMTMINQLRQEKENIILLDAGDQFQGTQWFYHYEGAATAYFMNRLGYDAMALNNHEFDNGISPLASFLQKVTFPIVSCNLDASKEESMEGRFSKSTVLNIAGEKVGIVGYTITNTTYISNPGENLVFEEEIPALQKEVSRLTENGVDKIIVLGTSGFYMENKIANQVEGVDVIVGGDPHVFLFNGRPPVDVEVAGPYPTVIQARRDDSSNGRVLIVQAGILGMFLGSLEVTFDDRGRVTRYHGNPIILDSKVAEDPTMMKEILQWKEPVERASTEVIGESYVHLDGERANCRLRECNMGNLITDAMLSAYVRNQGEDGWSDVTVAFINGGGIRASIEKGTITAGHVTTVLPFGDTVDVLELRGYTIIEILEHSVYEYDPNLLLGGFLQVSGLIVNYDIGKRPGSRVVSVEVLCSHCEIPQYQPLQLNDMYKVVLTSFLANGGDGYDMIKQRKQNHVIGLLDSVIMKQYIKKHSPITQAIENRITITGDPNSSHVIYNSPASVFLLIIVQMIFIAIL